MAETKLNILPVPTFGSLGVNYVTRDISGYETKDIVISSGSSESVVQYIDSDTETNVDIKSNAKLKLIQLFDSKKKCVSKLGISLEDNADIELIQLYLGGDTVSEIAARLDGAKSVFNAKIGYQLNGEDKLDINLIAEHTGRKSSSEIMVNGVLNDNAAKTFKGTIDFKNGAVGAQGSEKEDVIMMSEKVRNKTVPVILCAEEDVVGNHGATIGRIDDKHVFYMKSRGIPEEKIYELMARSKLAQIIAPIDDGSAKKRIYTALGWGEDIE